MSEKKKKTELKTFTAMVSIKRLDINVPIEADNLEGALTKAKALTITQILQFSDGPFELMDCEEVELSGLYAD